MFSNLNLVDSHCHPQMSQYDADRESVIKRATESGIGMICVGTDLDMSKKAIALAHRYEGIWASVGLHPNDLNYELRIMNYEELLKEPKVVAVGEVGLDYYRTPETEKQNLQKEFFKQFIDLAVKYKKPLILHCRDSRAGSAGKAYPDMLEILNSCFLIHDSHLRGVVHSYTGLLGEAKRFLDLGFYLGFNGIITFPPTRKATDGQVPGQYDEIVKYAPLDKILLETDAPYLTPEPYRGKRNEPLYVIEVAKKIAQLKGESLEKVIEVTNLSSIKLFNINNH